MKQQLIVNILGADDLGILGELAGTVSEAGCNILDSRQAIYGQDFCLTMILEGSTTAIARVEVTMTAKCHQLGVLSLVKRTQHHCRQDLARLADVEFAGLDAPGVLKKVTHFFAQNNIAINAFRQNTFVEKSSQANMLKCKMVVNLPADTDLDHIRKKFESVLDQLSLIGNINEKH